MKKQNKGEMLKDILIYFMLLVSIFIVCFLLWNFGYYQGYKKGKAETETVSMEEKYSEVPTIPVKELTSDQIQEEIKYGEMERVAQLIEAEAGNQDLKGMRLVADVIYNRKDSSKFPNNIEDIIYQRNPTQFSVTRNGAFDKAAYMISGDAFLASEMEYERSERLDTSVLYFNNSKNCGGRNHFKHGDHWFGY